MPEIITVSTPEAKERCKELALDNGLLVGISSGANILAAEHWVKAREVMNLAFSFTELEGRELPSNTEFNEGLELIGDIELATLVIDGKASAINEDDWWSMDMMA